MAWPTVAVEVAFTTDPLDTPSWTAVTGYVLSCEVNHGRDSEVGEYQPGTLAVTLDNSDRRFDPLHAAGPYFGDLKARKRIRVRATWDAVTYELFTGFVEGWPQTYQPPAMATVQLRATDWFGVLAGIELPSSVYAVEVAADSPDIWWKLNETLGDVMTDSSGNEQDGTYRPGTVDASTSHPNRYETNTALDLSAFRHGGALNTYPAPPQPLGGMYTGPVLTGDTFSFECVFRLSANEAGALYTYEFFAIESTYWQADLIDISSGDRRLYIWVDSTGSLNVSSRAEGDSFYVLDSADWRDDTTHHLVVTHEPTGLEVWADGALIQSDTSAVGFTADLGSYANVGVGLLYHEFSSDDGIEQVDTAWKGVLADVAVYDGVVLGDARIEAHAAAVAAPWDGDKTGSRVDRILDLAGIDAADRDISTGLSTAGPAVLNGNALALCKSMETTEDGDFYTDHRAGGQLRFADRHALFTDTRSTTAQATVTDDPAAASTSIRPDPGDIQLRPEDERYIYNDITVEWIDGAEPAENATSRATYTRKGLTVSTELRTATEARDRAEWLLNRYDDPATRVEGVRLGPASNNNEWPAALGLREGDRLALRFHPQQVGTAYTADFHVTGVHFTVDDGQAVAEAAFDVAPVDVTAFWVWGVTGVWADSTIWAQ